jgi:NitT/TauT family transport system permease protein
MNGGRKLGSSIGEKGKTSELARNSTPAAGVGHRFRVGRIVRSGHFLTLLTLVVLLVIWEVAVDAFDIRPYLLPAPSRVFQALLRFSDRLLDAAAYTARSIALGYLAAVAAGILIALPIALSSLMQRTVYPVLVLSQLVPKVALAPIFVIWFGFTLTPKVAVVFLLSFFPIVLNGIVGLRSIDPEIIHLTRSTGANALDTFLKVRLPYALPYFFAGFKLAAISATVGGVIGEFIGSDSGLGYVILVANGDLRTDISFAAILLLTMLGLILYFTIEILEHIALPWHVSQRAVVQETGGT